MSGNLCRCGAYVGILAAVRAAERHPPGGCSAEFEYLRADDARRAVATGAPSRTPTFLGGGTNLVDHLKLGVTGRDSSSTSAGCRWTQVEETDDPVCGSARTSATATSPRTRWSAPAARC